MAAAANGHTSIVRILLANGAYVDCKDFEDNTALMHAARLKQIEIIRCLIEAGADPKIEDASRETALTKAEEIGQIAIAEMLSAG